MSNSTADAAVQCGFAGNNDLYGLGLRVGIYLQFMATLAAKFFLPHEFKYLQAMTLVYVSANLIAVMRETALHTVRACEIFIMMWVLLPQFQPALKVGLLNIPEFLIYAVLMAFSIFMDWFYFRGIDGLPLPPGCQDYGFFFAKINLRGWFRTGSQVIWTLMAIIFGLSFLLLVFTRCLDKRKKDVQASATEDPLSVSNLVFGLSNVFIYIFCVAATETSIRWNEISDVYSIDTTSQFVAFFVGVGTFFFVAYKLFRLGIPGCLGTTEALGDDSREDEAQQCPRKGVQANSVRLRTRVSDCPRDTEA